MAWLGHTVLQGMVEKKRLSRRIFWTERKVVVGETLFIRKMSHVSQRDEASPSFLIYFLSDTQITVASHPLQAAEDQPCPSMSCLFGKQIGIGGEIIESSYCRNVDIPTGLWGGKQAGSITLVGHNHGTPVTAKPSLQAPIQITAWEGCIQNAICWSSAGGSLPMKGKPGTFTR